MSSSKQSRVRLAIVVVGALAAAALMWPAAPPHVADAPAGAQQFVWGRDSLWSALEASFERVRADGCTHESAARASADSIDGLLSRLGVERVGAVSPVLDALEIGFFTLAPRAAACGSLANEYVALQGRLREAIKWQSTAWNLTERAVRDRLYRSLYGSRAAAEEVMLQHQDSARTLVLSAHAPASATPAAMSNGVLLHSGDILVSRGGYPTSALIARGSDYPGNFSHIALVYVDSVTREISVIEAHIEKGVAIATADQYIADKKLRVMLLRPSPDLAAVKRDPMLPHRAAAAMLERARTEQVPYDFAMDYSDPSRLFCSEVASAAYVKEGVTLWTGISTITAPGLRRWLASFGVKQFETQEPSDLEYDPQLAVVAEWRNAGSLFDDHMDNAVTDAMLEGAERGDALDFAAYELPLARLMKGYSWLRGWAGFVGPIPEGMDPASALRNRSYNTRHAEIKVARRVAVERWTAEKGYRPPYWVLVALAREAAAVAPPR
jgi:hypothetical protein